MLTLKQKFGYVDLCEGSEQMTSWFHPGFFTLLEGHVYELKACVL